MDAASKSWQQVTVSHVLQYLARGLFFRACLLRPDEGSSSYQTTGYAVLELVTSVVDNYLCRASEWGHPDQQAENAGILWVRYSCPLKYDRGGELLPPDRIASLLNPPYQFRIYPALTDAWRKKVAGMILAEWADRPDRFPIEWHCSSQNFCVEIVNGEHLELSPAHPEILNAERSMLNWMAGMEATLMHTNAAPALRKAGERLAGLLTNPRL